MGLHGSGSHFFMGDENTYGISNRELARSDIRMAMEGEKPHLIDEWQEVPRIWDAVRSDIDRRGERAHTYLRDRPCRRSNQTTDPSTAGPAV